MRVRACVRARACVRDMHLTPNQRTRFDVVDVGREWMQTVPCVHALRLLASSWTVQSALNATAARIAIGEAISDLDRLLSAAKGFSFGAWIDAARNLSTTDTGKAQLELNARAQVSRTCEHSTSFTDVVAGVWWCSPQLLASALRRCE